MVLRGQGTRLLGRRRLDRHIERDDTGLRVVPRAQVVALLGEQVGVHLREPQEVGRSEILGGNRLVAVRAWRNGGRAAGRKSWAGIACSRSGYGETKKPTVSSRPVSGWRANLPSG